MTVEAYVRNTCSQPIYAVFLAWHPTADDPEGVEESYEPLLMDGDEMKASAPEPSLAFHTHQEWRKWQRGWQMPGCISRPRKWPGRPRKWSARSPTRGISYGR
jgi:hypothetical protein